MHFSFSSDTVPHQCPSSTTLLSTQASAIVCQCLLVLHVLPVHILIHSTQSSAKVCILLHVTLLHVYQCRYLFLTTTSTIHKYTSTILQIVNSFTRHSLDFYSYALHNLVSPHRYCIYIKPPHTTPTQVTALSCHLHGVKPSPLAHTTRTTNSNPSMITQRIKPQT